MIAPYDCAPMSSEPLAGPLPEFLDVRKAASRELSIDGTVALASMPRLAECVVAADGVAMAKFVFSRDAENRYVVELHVEAQVQVTCQRCLEPMDMPLRVRSRLALVGDVDSAKQLPGVLDPWIVDSDQASLWSLVEEELMLAVPVVAYHDDENCNALLARFRVPPVAEDSAQSSADNPFKVLEQLKPEHTEET